MWKTSSLGQAFFVSAFVLASYCSVTPARAESPPAISGFTPHAGPVGTKVVITGKRFSPLEGVKFGGGVNASGSFTSTQITVTVPAGAVTGVITVLTANGTVMTHLPFKVTVKKVSHAPAGPQPLYDGLKGN